MKLVSFSDGRAGIDLGQKILDIQKTALKNNDFKNIPGSVLGLIRSEAAFTRLAELISSATIADSDKFVLVDKAQAELSAPFEPLTIYAVGMNYTDHLEEMETPTPSRPYSFVKSSSAVIGNGQPIILPKGHDSMVDWEAELAIVVGKIGYQISETAALSHVFGYMCANDVSARDWAGNALDQAMPLVTIERWACNLLGKQYPTFAPLGPTLVTSDEVGDPTKLDIQCRINGAVMQKSNTRKMVFGVAELVSYLSQFQMLRPGDVILSGTMGGVGFGRNPKLFLKPGDVVEVEVEKLGILQNQVKL